MKRLFALLTAVLVLTLGCGEKVPEEGSIEAARERLGTDVCAVVFFGIYSGEFDGIGDYLAENARDDEFAFAAEIPESRFIKAGGEELYLIIPSAEVENVRINALNHFALENPDELGDELYSADASEPFFINCNASDIFPSSRITFTLGDETVEYSPSISLRDGNVATSEKIADFTDYEK